MSQEKDDFSLCKDPPQRDDYGALLPDNAMSELQLAPDNQRTLAKPKVR